MKNESVLPNHMSKTNAMSSNSKPIHELCPEEADELIKASSRYIVITNRRFYSMSDRDAEELFRELVWIFETEVLEWYDRDGDSSGFLWPNVCDALVLSSHDDDPIDERIKMIDTIKEIVEDCERALLKKRVPFGVKF
jgi:hypothetical protein